MENDIPKFIYYERKTLDFGDPAASEAVEAAEKKFIIPACHLKESKTILAETRYADNCLFSFQGKGKIKMIGNDIEQAHNLYS